MTAAFVVATAVDVAPRPARIQSAATVSGKTFRRQDV